MLSKFDILRAQRERCSCFANLEEDNTTSLADYFSDGEGDNLANFNETEESSDKEDTWSESSATNFGLKPIPGTDYKEEEKTSSIRSPASQTNQDSISQNGNRTFLQSMPSKVLLLNLGHQPVYSRTPPHRSLPAPKFQQSRSPATQPDKLQHRDNHSDHNRERHPHS